MLGSSRRNTCQQQLPASKSRRNTSVEREHGVDRVKAVATLCVVAIHCQTPFGIGRTDLLGRAIPALTEWAVPAFFFVGGYVRARTTPYSPGTTRRWLLRLLPVYLLASLLALLCRRYVLGETVALEGIPLSLLTGSAWGVYYFVPLFLGVLVFSHALARWPRSGPWICTISIAALVLTRWNPDLDPFWRAAGFHGIARSPLFWWGYFCAGWVIKQRLERTHSGLIVALSAIAAVVCLVAILAEAPPLAKALARVGVSIAVPMALLFASVRRLGSAMALLSEHSYEVYLFHFFAIAIAQHWGLKDTGVAASLALWAIAFTSGLGAAILSRYALQRVTSSALRS